VRAWEILSVFVVFLLVFVVLSAWWRWVSFFFLFLFLFFLFSLFFGDGSTDPLGSLYGIHPGLGPQHEGLPFIQISGGVTLATMGKASCHKSAIHFQWSDSVTKPSRGNHSFKFGGDVRRQRFDQTLYFDVNGEFFLSGSGANSVVGPNASNFYPDFLMGLPDSFGQGSAQVEHVRSTALYLFAQDSWKIKPNVTLNYGLRWELNTPIADVSKHVQTFPTGPGETRFILAAAPILIVLRKTPVGLVVPEMPRPDWVNADIFTRLSAPRIGIAWSPGHSARPAFARVGGSSITPSSNWYWSSSALSRLSE